MYFSKDIVKEGNKILKNVSSKVTLPLSSEDLTCLKGLYEYVVISAIDELVEKYKIRPGVGLAANQVGVKKRMIAIYFVDEKGEINQYGLVNPKLISNSVAQCYLATGEGCLSVPEAHQGLVKRAHKIKMKAYDHVSKQEVTLSLKGYVAIVLQHEYDHLFGKVYYDRINKKNPFEVKEGEIEII